MEPRIIRVMLVDDHEMVRDVIAQVLELQDDVTVVGSVGDGDQALALAETACPDVVLMDLDMPVLDGIGATAALCERSPQVRVVMLSATCSRRKVREAFDAGACGFLLKDGTPGDLCAGVRTAAGGGRPLADAVRRLVGPPS